MAFIYYIWSRDSHGRGGYIGLDSGSISNKDNRIAQHIYGVNGINSSNPDGAARLIADKGISNVLYGYWDESDNYGIDRDVFDGFQQAGWIAKTGNTANQNLMAAEVLHIIYNIEKGLQRTSANTTVGGQLKGDVLEYKPYSTFAGKKLEPVRIHLGDRIQSWETNSKKKLFFPEQYAISKKILKDVLMDFLQQPSVWVNIIKKYILPKINGVTSNFNPNKSLQIRFTNYLKKIEPGFSWNRYHIQTPNIDFNSFIKEFENWFLNTLQGSISNFNKRKEVPKRLFHIRVGSYSNFTPINNNPPKWFNLLLTKEIKTPNKKTPTDATLVYVVQNAATKVFNHILNNTQKYDLTSYQSAPPPVDYLRNRVEIEMQKYGLKTSHFVDWNLSYRYYVSYWLHSKQRKPLVKYELTNNNNLITASSYNPPNFFYWFTPSTWSLITSIRDPKDIPFNLL